ncbi:MAG: Dihydrofolate reductase type 3 [Accumulibacter sp.]|uniref:dihydrofolate reductase n=1 Tax=Accumulibacter sp. TaxID=2053492 RepID=UPI00122169CB|nr:dihydrofolate reductase [Accumulibacter sp.]TLD47035.1 MAG: Dihydrofolate reductase type 3 [Accumulibacter sp.]
MISLIAVVSRNLVIGRNQRLLWRLPEDLRHFRATTGGKPVIMGRKTWESLPEAFRPLPGRHNIVVSRNPRYHPHGASRAASLEEALRIAGDAGEVFVIGGAELYRQTLPMAERLYLTEVAAEASGDAFFPALPRGQWQEVSRRAGRVGSPLAAADCTTPDFDFVVYERARLQPALPPAQ